MNPILIEPILWRWCLSRIAHHHKRKRHDALRELAVLGKPGHAVIHRIDSGPHRSQPKRVGSDEEVLRGCRTVLHPESRDDDVPRVCADEYAKGCMCRHSRIRAKRGNPVEHFPILYDDKLPRLFIRRRGCTHRCREELLYDPIINLSSYISSYAFTRLNGLSLIHI